MSSPFCRRTAWSISLCRNPSGGAAVKYTSRDGAERDTPVQRGVDQDQRDSSDDPTEKRVVVADHRVLHDVGQKEDHDEVERVQICEVPFAGKAEQHGEEPVHDDGSQNLLSERDLFGEHVMPHRRSSMTDDKLESATTRALVGDTASRPTTCSAQLAVRSSEVYPCRRIA
jgi:hypothetical protein